jgi:metallo-beta-lactamase family protein
VNKQGQTVWWSGEVWGSEAFSSHADQGELIQWLSLNPKTKICLIHGETEAKLKFKDKLSSEGHEVLIPAAGSSLILE